MNTNDLSNIVNAGNTLTSVLSRFFPYWGLEGKALDVYIDEIKKSDKPAEVKVFEILNAKKSVKKIKNTSNILELATNYLSEADIKAVSYEDNEEWFDSFFESSGNVSDEQAQIIWAKILANEIKCVGSAPRGIFRILSEITPELATSFNRLCEQRLIFISLNENNEVIPNSLINEVIKFDDNEYYNKIGLGLSVINELESIGLVVTSLGYYKKLHNVNKLLVSDGVFTERMIIKNEELQYGTLMLTKAGLYLLKIINPPYAKDQYYVMREYYEQHHCTFEASDKKVYIDNDQILVAMNKQQ